MVKGTLNIASNAVSVFRSIRTEQSAFKKDVESTSKALQKTWNKKWSARVETSAASKKIQSLKKSLEPLRKKVVTALAVKDAVTTKVRTAADKVKALGKMVAKPVITIKDKVSAGLSKVTGKLKSIAKTVAIPVAVAAGVTAAAIGGTISAGMELEQQQASMSHFIQATNKDMSASQVQSATDAYVADLRENANTTPFETGEVMEAGSRAVAIAGGDTQGAMDLVRLAEDMAAASGGTKSISDAMEALADAKVGEMERLKEFGFKVSADDFQAKGFEGVAGELSDFYGGAAERLAQTGAGLMSTIKGKLKSSVADLGLSIVDKLKPVFQNVITMLDSAQPAIEAFGSLLSNRVGSAINFLSAVLPQAIGFVTRLSGAFSGFGSGMAAAAPAFEGFGQAIMEALEALLPVVSTAATSLGSLFASAAPVITGVVQIISGAISTLAPVVSTIFGGIAAKIGEVTSFLGGKMGFLKSAFSTAFAGIASVLSTAWSVIGPVISVAISIFKVLFNVVQAVFPAIKSIIEGVWNFLKPIFEAVGGALSAVAEGVGWLADKVGGWIGIGGEEPAVSQVEESGVESVTPSPAGEAGPTGSDDDPITVDMDLDDPQYDIPDWPPDGWDPAGGGDMAIPAMATDMAATPASAMGQPAEQHIDQSVSVQIASLAGSITIKEEVDIDAVAQRVVDQVTAAVQNAQANPLPA